MGEQFAEQTTSPPYFESERFYYNIGYVFGEEQHIVLKDALTAIKGRFILSYNDCQPIRDLYKGFEIETITRQNSLSSKYGTGRIYNELIIKNY